MEIKEFYTEKEKDTIFEEYVNFSNMEKEGKAGKESLRKVVEQILGSDDEYKTENHKAWFTACERKSFDEEGLKTKYPEIWQEFTGKKVIVSLHVK